HASRSERVVGDERCDMITPARLAPCSAGRVGGAFQEVWPVPARLVQRRPPPPLRDPRMVSRQQDLGHLHAAELTGPRVMRVIQQALLERLLTERFLVADDARN